MARPQLAGAADVAAQAAAIASLGCLLQTHLVHCSVPWTQVGLHLCGRGQILGKAKQQLAGAAGLAAPAAADALAAAAFLEQFTSQQVTSSLKAAMKWLQYVARCTSVVAGTASAVYCNLTVVLAADSMLQLVLSARSNATCRHWSCSWHRG